MARVGHGEPGYPGTMTEQEHEPVESARPRLDPSDSPGGVQPEALEPEENEDGDGDRQDPDARSEHGPPSESPDPV